MKPILSKAAAQLRKQVNELFPGRDKVSDGWLGDTRHGARKSDHNPDVNGWVRAIDLDRDLSGKTKPDLMPDLVDQLRIACKNKTETRVSYIIFDGRICSRIMLWRWRTYKGINKHVSHAHISFTKAADNNGKPFAFPMI